MTDLVKELRASYDPNDAVPMQVCLDAADRIEKLEADLEIATMKRILDADRIEKLEAALDDVAGYLARADWYYLKPETRKALEGKDD